MCEDKNLMFLLDFVCAYFIWEASLSSADILQLELYIQNHCLAQFMANNITQVLALASKDTECILNVCYATWLTELYHFFDSNFFPQNFANYRLQKNL